MKALQYLNKYLLKYKWRLLSGVIFIAAANGAAIFPAIFFGNAVNTAIWGIAQYQSKAQIDTTEFQNRLLLYTALILGTALLQATFTFFQRQTIIVTSRKIEYDLKNEVYEHYQKLSPNFYKNNRIGDLMSRLSEDIIQVRMYLGPGIMYPLNMLFSVLIVVIQMYRTDSTLATYALIPLPILAYTIFRISRVIHQKSTRKQRLIAQLTAFVQEKISGIRITKSFGMEDYALQQYKALADKTATANLNLARVEAWFFPTVLLLIGLSYISVLYLGGVHTRNADINAGQIASFILYLNMMVWPVTAIGWVTSVIQRAAASQKRINDFLAEKPDIINRAAHAHCIRGKVAFKNVCFQYENTGIQALTNISFTINPGETLGIFGETGAGKSTIAELIARFYEADRGVVAIDGQPIDQINPYELRKSLGYVPQEAALFSDTLANNIGFSTDHPSPSAIRESAEVAAVHSDIMSFTKRYRTQIGERGVMLSGGQKQRISIARAILKDPVIYIFDDSLSAVDTETEAQILRNLQSAAADKTTLIISHRVSPARYCDKIIVLKNGHIVQRGTHKSLIDQEGYYKSTYERQALGSVVS